MEAIRRHVLGTSIQVETHERAPRLGFCVFARTTAVERCRTSSCSTDPARTSLTVGTATRSLTRCIMGSWRPNARLHAASARGRITYPPLAVEKDGDSLIVGSRTATLVLAPRLLPADRASPEELSTIRGPGSSWALSGTVSAEDGSRLVSRLSVGSTHPRWRGSP